MKSLINNLIINELIETFIYKYGYLEYLKSNSVMESPYYYYKVKYRVNSKFMNLNFIAFKKKILNFDNRMGFLFMKEGYIKDPKNFTDKDLQNVQFFIDTFKSTFLFELALLHYEKNNANLKLKKNFVSLLNRDLGNFHLSLEYIRYQGSSLYKLHDKDLKYLNLAIGDLNKIIRKIEKDSKNTFTFIYSWLGYLLIELNDYNNAIRYLNKTILLNSKRNQYYSYESLFWKSLALNKKESYKKSLDIFNFIIDHDIGIEKRDFRFYKLLSENLYYLGKTVTFYKNLRNTIEMYLKVGDLILIDGQKLNLSNTIVFHSSPQYKSFILYNNKYLHDDIDHIIFTLAFFFYNALLQNFSLNNNRGLEELSYKYLQTVYEGKIE